jgi:diguanylate cyclase
MANDPTEADVLIEQELDDTRQRASVGGVYYVAGWMIVAVFGDAAERAPLGASVVLVAFTLLFAVRIALNRVALPTPSVRLRVLQAYWAVFIATAAIWGFAMMWVHSDAGFTPARPAALVCTIAFGTAFSATLSMRLSGTLVGIALLCLPTLACLWLDPAQRAVSIAMSIYLLYLVSAARQGSAEYWRHRALDLELRRQRDRFEWQSRTDALTDLSNRREFFERAEDLIRLRDAKQSVAMLLFDLDHFKDINDRHGHAAGDVCLIAFAEALRAHFGAHGEVLARLGGEEFGVLVRMETAEATKMAEALRARIADAPVVAPLQITVSIGVAPFVASRHDGVDSWYSDADAAMYRAKRAGRNRVCVGEVAA